ncbi:MAG: NUDIX hydrolase [Azospirillaceae bacterium]|nr:NUDIX hydrolase [Azospirillaceae bacterium]
MIVAGGAAHHDIETMASRVVYENRWMRVREDAIRRADGSDGIYGVVEKTDFVLIVPLDREGRVHLVEQFRYPVRGRYWEFPQGSWEQQPDAAPHDVARGELREETGLDAAALEEIGYLFPGYGYSNQGCRVFLATGLGQGPATLEHEEQDLITAAFPVAAVVQMICQGEIKDAATVAAFGLLRLKGLL